MTLLYDIVNFNGDGSCLDSGAWLSILHGGEHSRLFRWLRLYVDFGMPISLGFTGATLADISFFNPDALTLLQAYSDIFQIIWRPFSHDLPFFRTEQGFCLNLEFGRRAAEKLVGRIAPIYVPPEFMQTNRQTALLIQRGVEATVIMGKRFREKDICLLPDRPFWVKGIPNGQLMCIPVVGSLTDSYLATIQLLDRSLWESALIPYSSVAMWRDGESSFLLPDGIERERFWLSIANVERAHMHLAHEAAGDMQLRSYPIHPFSSWMNEMSMLWFLQRVRELESTVVESPSPRRVSRWFNCIGSDILSAVEKPPPVVRLRALEREAIKEFVILRSERGFEGEALLEIAEKDMDIHGHDAWQMKAQARERLIFELF